MKNNTAGVTILEVLLAIVVLGIAALACAWTFPTVELARLDSDISREAVAWHHQYAMGLATGDFERAATAGAGPNHNAVTLPSGITINVTDAYSAPISSMPSALFIQSTATWSITSGSGTGTSVITVARGTPPTVL